MGITIYLCTMILVFPLWHIAISLEEINKKTGLKSEKEEKKENNL